jgi:hypothetical protein
MKTIKVQSKYVHRKKDPFFKVPELRISGKWIEKSGISIGSIVEVLLEENTITIRKV